MSMSLREATTTWWLGVVASSLLSGRGRPFIADFCEGINCNPTCPDGFNLGKIRNDWTTAVDGMTSVSAFTYVLVCAFIVYKLAMKIQRHRLCVHVRHSRDSQSTGLTVRSHMQYDTVMQIEIVRMYRISVTSDVVTLSAMLMEQMLNNLQTITFSCTTLHVAVACLVNTL